MNSAVDAMEPVRLKDIGLFTFFCSCFGPGRFVFCPEGFFFPFAPPAQFLLSFTHGLVLLSL
jgi:hypothetical protein